MEQIAPGIRLVRAGNASALTGSGTNSWLVGAPSGRGPVAVIDPGPDDPAHLQAILSAAGEVSHILLTHPHLDHSALAPALKAATGAPVLAFGAATEGRSPLMQALAAREPQTGGEGLDLGFVPDRRLADGERITGAGWQLTALHTPGHAAAHMAFLSGEALFTGDLVMGWSTTLISPPDGDLGALRRSLARLAALPLSLLLPGHGAPVAEAVARIRWLQRHRAERTAAIGAALGPRPQTLAALAARIYPALPQALLPAARRTLFAHLIDMVESGEAEALPLLGSAAAFRAP